MINGINVARIMSTMLETAVGEIAILTLLRTYTIFEWYLNIIMYNYRGVS